MTKDPWTDPDPQPGDFDADLADMDLRDFQVVEAGSGAKLTILVRVEGDDAMLLARLAKKRGEGLGEVVAELIRNA